MKRCFAILILITVLVLAGLVVFVKSAVFPFVELMTIRDVADFNAPPDKALLSYGVPQLRSDHIRPHSEATGLQESWLAYGVREYLRAGEGTVLSHPEMVLREEPPAVRCSEYAKLTTSLAAFRNIPARVVWVSGHTVSEIWRKDLKKWVLVDTYGNQMFFPPGGGGFLNVADLINDAQAEMSRPVFSVDPPAFEPKALELYRITDICVVLEGPRLYDFHKRNYAPDVLIGYLFGGEPVARGIQYVPPGKTPKAGSVIVTVRIVLTALVLMWTAAIAVAIRRRARSGAAAASTDLPPPTPQAQ
ncbi:MAG: hypothetical protein ACYTAF_02400 [Planctomycetota bacterium]|jgi:hypothetical protein